MSAELSQRAKAQLFLKKKLRWYIETFNASYQTCESLIRKEVYGYGGGHRTDYEDCMPLCWIWADYPSIAIKDGELRTRETFTKNEVLELAEPIWLEVKHNRKQGELF